MNGKKKTTKTTQKKKTIVTPIKKTCDPDDLLPMTDECILKVLQYLSILDLFRLSVISSRLKKLVCENVLNERLIDFDECLDIGYDKVFAMFGKFMVNIKIGEKHVQNSEPNQSKFDEILHQIGKHCQSDGLLKHVEFQFSNATTVISEAVVKDVLPLMRNIESFAMNEPTNVNSDCHFQLGAHNVINFSINKFIDVVLMNASKIKSIKLANFRVSGGWLLSDHMKNVETLSFTNCNLEKNPGLIAFMQKKPALNSFTWRNSSVDRVNDPTNFVLSLAGNNVPDLQVLDFKCNFGHFENNIYVRSNNTIPIKHQFLVQFLKLKELNIMISCNPQPSVSGINVSHLQTLAQQNSIEKFTISFNEYYHTVQKMEYLQHFTSLKCVKIIHPEIICGDFFHDFLSNLPNLKECRLVSNSTIYIQTATLILQSATKITVLKLEAPIVKISANSYAQLLQIRTQNLCDEPLRLYVDKSQLTCMKQLKKKYKPDVVCLVPFTYKSF